MNSWHECKNRRWTKEMILEFIQKKGESMENLTPKQVQLHCPALYGAAVRHFGGWRQAVEAAGFNYSQVLMRHGPGYWDFKRVIEEIQFLESKHSSFVRKKRKDLYCAALRLFGSWEMAVGAAGLDYAVIQQGWSPVDSAGIRFIKRNGK